MKNIWLATLAVVAWFFLGGARAQEVTNTNHTVVRLQISTGGQPFGSLDLELFDQEKPETVKNFLRYVYRGAYSNLVIHRLVTDFILQAGHMTVTNPASTNAFSSYVAGPNFGPITNEYSVGPELSNAYGTIAMARVSGQPNSASANWFINLANNPSFDAADGGFTVFGRVVNATNAFTGTNLLAYLNSAAVNSATVQPAFIPGPAETYANLPVSGLPLAVPRYADLFTVSASILQGPDVPAPQHTVVRMNIFTGGVNFGNIDVELFDQEKPETVRNFLIYVYSEVFSNLVIHRLIPKFALQAGRVRVAEPSAQAAFTNYVPGVNWGDITNEFSVGPELLNQYGTLAVSRIPGETNSASADFFFNLTNNPHLNTNDGGFTVFGRVVNSYDARSGTNVLNYFNRFARGAGLTSVTIPRYLEVLGDLPVSINRPVPLISDLFTIQAQIVQGGTTRDTNAPSAAVLEPLASPPPVYLRTTNSSYHFAGTAEDNEELARVLVDGPQGRRVASGKSNWTMEVPLAPGTNRIMVYGLDYFGNLSPGQERIIFYSLPRPVVLQVEGKGRVQGITNGQIMEVGVTYPLTATPAKGQYFLSWSGNQINSAARTVSFTMYSGAVVVCRFSPNFLGLAPGRYEGVFYPATNGPPESEGIISLTLRRDGSYSGRVNPFGVSYGIRGLFNTSGQSQITGLIGTRQLVLLMGLYAEGYEAIGGSYADGTFASDFNLWRQQVHGKVNPTPYAGQYTFTLSPPAAAGNTTTDGTGFGVATVNSRGRIKWTAALASQAKTNRAGAVLDAPSIKGRGTVLKDGRWLLYYPAKTGEALAGEAFFTSTGTFAGDIKWFSPSFPGRTNQNVKLQGARYAPPASARPFDWTNGVLTISGGGLAEPIVSAVEWQTNGTFLISSNPHNVQLTVANATGLVGGSFTHPGSSALTRLRGTVLQSSNSAAGFFLHRPQNGGFQLRRAP